MAERFYDYHPQFQQHIFPYTVAIKFQTQPPEDLRKSNFFNFTIELSTNNHPIEIQEACFMNFLNEDKGIRNGIKYRLRVRYANNLIEVKYLYLTLVDALTKKPVKYEGHDDNPKMQRALLTHEAICTRCSLQKSCGNKNEAPSDPQILSKGALKFFLKCNQNCLKGAGNPRDMRRFAIAVSFDDITNDQCGILATSDKIFVHNNSKHNRKRKKEMDLTPVSPLEPTEVGVIHPAVGIKSLTFSFYSKEWGREGVNFKSEEGIQLPVTSIIPRIGLTVVIPFSLRTGVNIITMLIEDTPIFCFPYEIQDKYADVSRASPGFLCLFRTNWNDFPVKLEVGPNNKAEYVLPPQEFSNPYSYPNGARQAAPLSYGSTQNFVCNSSTPSPEINHLSGGSESSPSYPCSHY